MNERFKRRFDPPSAVAKPPVNILVLQSELGVLRGGGENFTRNLFEAFARRGHTVMAAFVANTRGKYPLGLPSGMHPIPIPGWWSINFGQHSLATIGRYIPRGGHLRKEWDHIQEAISWRTIKIQNARFRQRIEREFALRWDQFDAIYVHSNTQLASSVANQRPTVLRLPGPVTAELEPELRKVHAVCANGDALVRIRQFLGDHAIELPIGIDSDLFKTGHSSIRRDLGWTERHRVIGYVGRLMHLKGVDVLAATFRRVLGKIPDARLLMIGKGPEETHIRSTLAKELSNRSAHIEPDIEHCQLAQWYQAMDLLVMPSRYENLSNALIESMACGIPFLASDIGGNRILAETGAGWLFKSESDSSLTGQLLQILKGDSELKVRGKAGAEYARNRCSWSATAEHLERIISTRLGVKK